MDDNKNTAAPECEGTEEEIITEDIAAEEAESTEDETAAAEKKCSGKEKKKLKRAEAEIEKLTAQLAEANDKYARLYAEYDNFRKRSAKEREGVYSDAYCDALTQILPILDNLERAAAFTGEEADSPMAKGLELTLKSFVETMNKMGVFEIEAQGMDFDPNRHNAVMHIEDENEGENKVVEVFMKGYAKGDKVLRYSMVKVAN